MFMTVLPLNMQAPSYCAFNCSAYWQSVQRQETHNCYHVVLNEQNIKESIVRSQTTINMQRFIAAAFVEHTKVCTELSVGAASCIM